MSYDWAQNSIKLRRILDKLGENATEEQVKAEYIREGGLLNEIPILNPVEQFSTLHDIAVESLKRKVEKKIDKIVKKAIKKTPKKVAKPTKKVTKKPKKVVKKVTKKKVKKSKKTAKRA